MTASFVSTPLDNKYHTISKAWFFKRAIGRKEKEDLIAHRMRGHFERLKKGRLKKDIDYQLLGPLVDIRNQLATM